MMNWTIYNNNQLFRVEPESANEFIAMAKLYSLEEAKTPEELNEKITARLASGWQLVGGPYSDGKKHFQAVQR